MDKIYSYWQQIDTSGNPKAFESFLESVSSLDSYIAYKKKSYELLELKEGHSAIDIGCGIGVDLLNLKSLVSTSGRVVGLDTSEFMLECARKKIREIGLEIETKIGSAIKIPFENSTFDVCRCDRVIKYIENPSMAFAEFMRITKPGGRIVVIDQDWDSWTMNTVYQDLFSRLKSLKCAEFPNGEVCTQLFTLADNVGMKGLITFTSELERNNLSSYKSTLSPLLKLALKRHIVTELEVSMFICEQETNAQNDEFLTKVSILGVIGRK